MILMGDFEFLKRGDVIHGGSWLEEGAVRGENGFWGEEAKKGGSWNPGWNHDMYSQLSFKIC